MAINGKTIFAYANTGATFTALATGWTTVADVTDYSLPEGELDDIETTTHSTSGPRTYMAGLTESGEAEITCHYDKTVYAAVKALRGVTKMFRLMFSDASGEGFTGYVNGYHKEVDLEGLTVMVFKFKVSGDTTEITAIA